MFRFFRCWFVTCSPTEEEKCAPLRSSQIKAASASIWGHSLPLLLTRDLPRPVHKFPPGILALIRRDFNHLVNLPRAVMMLSVNLLWVIAFWGMRTGTFRERSSEDLTIGPSCEILFICRISYILWYVKPPPSAIAPIIVRLLFFCTAVWLIVK